MRISLLAAIRADLPPRLAPAATTTMADSRFDTSQWGKSELAGSPSKRSEDDGRHSDDEAAEPVSNGGKVLQPLSRSELESFEKKEKKKGIIYISRIPHGMTVAKVRHLLSGFGEVDRIYLQDGREKETGEKRTGRQSKSAHFTEGWVEFLDRKVAKATAEMLNAEPIGAASGGSGGGKGGKKAGGLGARRWRDEIWTMKYLSGFKWGMLSEQLGECGRTSLWELVADRPIFLQQTSGPRGRHESEQSCHSLHLSRRTTCER